MTNGPFATFDKRLATSSRLNVGVLAVNDMKQELLDQVNGQRNELMSNYAQLLNQVLAATPDQNVDHNLRLADFATISARIANAMHRDEEMESAMLKVRRSQMNFATEESALYLAIDRWVNEKIKLGDASVNNEGRRVLAKDLLHELQQTSDHYSIPFRIKTPNALGMQIRNMADELGLHFEIASRQSNKGSTYEIRRLEQQDPEQSMMGV